MSIVLLTYYMFQAMLIFLIFICIALVFKDVCFAFNDTFNGDLSMSCPSMKNQGRGSRRPGGGGQKTQKGNAFVSSQNHLINIMTHIVEKDIYIYMGLSENSVPLHPMVNDHYPY